MTRPFLAPPRLRLWTAGLAGILATAGGCRVEDVDTTGGTSSGSTSSGTAGGGGEAGGGAGGSAPGEPLKVMNWNTRNFFNAFYDGAVPDQTVVSQSQYEAKRAAVGAVIKALDPDVLVLQEVENVGILQDLNESELGGAYPNAALVDSNDTRGIDVGALSKLPFDDVVSHKDDTFAKVGTQGPIYQFARDAVELHLTRNGRHVVLIGVHFRSKGQSDDPDKRLAEAQRARAIADAVAAADPTAAIAVLGDFNDLPGSPPVQAVLGSGEAAFDDVAGQVPAADRWTFDYNGELELIDHQAANPVLRGMLDPASVRIPHDGLVEEAGDHAPILATYSVTPP